VQVLSPAEEAELFALEREQMHFNKRLLTASHESELERCRKDVWYFATTYCKTLDETRPDDPDAGDMDELVVGETEKGRILRYPSWPMLHDMFRLWMAYPEIRIYMIEKSRRMLVTLTHVGPLFVHDCMFHSGSMNFITSMNEEKASKQIERRAAIVYEHLPEWMKAVYPAKATYCHMVFPGKNNAQKYGFKKDDLRKPLTSEIWSVPQRGEQTRSETPSNVLFDEIVAQDMAEMNFTALWPALEAGKKVGPRFIGVSTAGVGFFDRAIHDRMN